MWVRPRPKSEHEAEPYCGCTIKRTPVAWAQLSCSCGEENDLREWRWQRPEERPPETEQSLSTTTIVVSEDQREVTFHPFYSSGTALVRGDSPLEHGCHYYWEVKMLTESYGTDIMVGLGTDKVNTSESMFKFTSLLGSDAESYGLSYKGGVRHAAATAHDSTGFCRGSLVGVRVDMWQGTLEFYLNRKPQGVSFYNLRRHRILYPMVCSTAAQSSMRLTYAASWRASLLVDAAKVLAHSVSQLGRPRLPPGLWWTMKDHFWLTLPTEGCIDEDEDKASVEVAPAPVTKSMIAEVMPSPFINGFYVDSIERDYRVVVWE